MENRAYDLTKKAMDVLGIDDSAIDMVIKHGSASGAYKSADNKGDGRVSWYDFKTVADLYLGYGGTLTVARKATAKVVDAKLVERIKAFGSIAKMLTSKDTDTVALMAEISSNRDAWKAAEKQARKELKANA